jgi:5-methylcytosine-specific restriction enzyme A
MHQRGNACKSKPKPTQQKETTAISRFRSCYAWQKKRRQIKERDNYLCMACLNNLDGTTKQYNFDGLEVHHIKSVHRAWNSRLEDTNLITLCNMHHYMADNKLLDADVLSDIANKNTNSKWISK